MHRLDTIRVAGYKSIRDQTIDLRDLNVLIGANGSGKSNLISVFRLLNDLVEERLQLGVARAGGAEQLLHFGSKATDEIVLDLWFDPNGYRCRLVPAAGDLLVFGEEEIFYQGPDYDRPFVVFLGRGHKETGLHEESRRRSGRAIADHILEAIEGWKLYHFHDTSSSAKVKQTGDLADNLQLRPDAGNLSAFLYRLQESQPDSFRSITDAVRLVAPFFDRFNLHPDRLNPDKIRLEWLERGSDTYFDANALSDGTLRFMALATLLLQPQPPTTIVIDEPELGLHPYAITMLADLFRVTSERTQVVVSTQSVTLVNQLSPEDVIVVDRQGTESVFRRPSADQIASWLDDYALGELWEKNVLGGRPGR